MSPVIILFLILSSFSWNIISRYIFMVRKTLTMIWSIRLSIVSSVSYHHRFLLLLLIPCIQLLSEVISSLVLLNGWYIVTDVTHLNWSGPKDAGWVVIHLISPLGQWWSLLKLFERAFSLVRVQTRPLLLLSSMGELWCKDRIANLITLSVKWRFTSLVVFSLIHNQSSFFV